MDKTWFILKKSKGFPKIEAYEGEMLSICLLFCTLGQKEEESQTGRGVASTEALGVGDPPPQVRAKRTPAKVMQRALWGGSGCAASTGGARWGGSGGARRGDGCPRPSLPGRRARRPRYLPARSVRGGDDSPEWLRSSPPYLVGDGEGGRGRAGQARRARWGSGRCVGPRPPPEATTMRARVL
ncbi:Os11g0517300 [Oryza sativa Japonica Group]|uniref:Os11g0517300 protein n=1 Tax=Oryza sativa subsp. japonica TaxID=39947 RepID=A0A0P0Y2V5_ORYSJ|nr:Os11g0517300 [Oryza sativa Japonica Group]